MGVVKEWFLYCDCCEDSTAHGNGHTTAQGLRKEVKSWSDWHMNLPGGRDICPDCWDRGLR